MLILLTSLLGCKHYDSVEDACADGVPGDGTLEDGAAANYSVDFVHRANCYRRYVGLSQGSVQYAVQYAVEQHAEYLAQNDLETLATTWGTEVNGPGYYGPDAYARLDAAGYDYDFGDQGLWEILWTLDPAEASGADIIDSMMSAPDWHEIVLQFEPRAIAAAHGVDSKGVPFVYANIVYDFPASEFHSWVTWPHDGQEGAPTASKYGFGTPLSIVVGSTTAAESYDGVNPYEIEIVRVPQLVGPDGPVSVNWLTPGVDPLVPIRYSAIGAPAKELEPNTSYTLDGEFRWDGGQKDFRISFETGEETVVETTAITRVAEPHAIQHRGKHLQFAR
jgi:hypothetical protein